MSGGGGGGSNDVPPPPLGTQYAFQNQPGADTGSYTGASSIANNSFYPNPGMSSFLFPQGVKNAAGFQTIAPQGTPPPSPPPPPPAPSGGGSSFTPSMAQQILAGNYALLTPAQQAQIQTMAGVGTGPSSAASPNATNDQVLATDIFKDAGGQNAPLSPADQAELTAIAYGGGGGGGGGGGSPGSVNGTPGMSVSPNVDPFAQTATGGFGSGYQGGAPAYPGGQTAGGGGGGGGLNQQAIDQGGIGGGGTMNMSYPGAAAFVGLGPGIASSGQNISGINQGLFNNIQNAQQGAGAVGQSLEQESTNPAWSSLYGAGGNLVNQGQTNPFTGASNSLISQGQVNPLTGTANSFLDQSTNSGLQGFEQQTLGTAFDPQNALYDRTLQQVQDQTRAGLEVRGVDMSPYGAGVESDATKNFNIDWQNAQLTRQGQGAANANTLAGMQSGLAGTGGSLLTQGAGIQSGLTNAGANLYGTGTAAQTGLSNAGANVIGTGAGAQAGLAKGGEGVLAQNTLAQGTSSDIAQAGLSGQISALQALQQGAVSAYAQPQQSIQDYLSYLQAATGQNSVNANIYGSQLNAANQAQSNSNQMGLGLLGAASSIIGK